jgi:hypothetical protein
MMGGLALNAMKKAARTTAMGTEFAKKGNAIVTHPNSQEKIVESPYALIVALDKAFAILMENASVKQGFLEKIVPPFSVLTIAVEMEFVTITNALAFTISLGLIVPSNSVLMIVMIMENVLTAFAIVNLVLQVNHVRDLNVLITAPTTGIVFLIRSVTASWDGIVKTVQNLSAH